MRRFFQNKSRSRRLQYQWLTASQGQIPAAGKVLDLGGVRGAEYHALLKLAPDSVIVWNMDAKTSPDAMVDLDDVAGFPAFPAGVNTVIALNLLEHLYRPFELLDWVSSQLPAGGRLLAAVPFAYPIHPSPNDYWRITPQAFEKFFEELAKKKRITGELTVVPLGSDFREGTSLLTSELFKSSRTHRMLAIMIENTALVASAVGKLVIGKDRIQKWADRNPPAIGLLWKKT